MLDCLTVRVLGSFESLFRNENCLAALVDNESQILVRDKNHTNVKRLV